MFGKNKKAEENKQPKKKGRELTDDETETVSGGRAFADAARVTEHRIDSSLKGKI